MSDYIHVSGIILHLSLNLHFRLVWIGVDKCGQDLFKDFETLEYIRECSMKKAYLRQKRTVQLITF